MTANETIDNTSAIYRRKHQPTNQQQHPAITAIISATNNRNNNNNSDHDMTNGSATPEFHHQHRHQHQTATISSSIVHIPHLDLKTTKYDPHTITSPCRCFMRANLRDTISFPIAVRPSQPPAAVINICNYLVHISREH